MVDRRFESLHLEELPRRLEFRAARAKLHSSCSEETLAGELGLLDVLESGDLPVVVPEADSRLTFWVQDGADRHPLVIGVNSIGRLPDNTVVLKDNHVSRRHCAIVVHRDGHCEVHDIASKNGTLLNGDKITGPTVVHPGDTLSLCNRRIKLLAIIAPQDE